MDNAIDKCESLNMYGCLTITKKDQYCKWMGKNCLPLKIDDISYSPQILVNVNVCSKVYLKD